MKITFLFLIFCSFISFSQIQTISNQKTIGTGFNELSFNAKLYDGFLYSFITPDNSGVSQDKLLAGFGSQDGWFVKMDLNFNIISQSVYGGDFGDAAVDFVKCANGDFILLMGSYSGVAGNKSEPNFGVFGDYWVVRVNPAGSIVWQKCYGGSDDDNPEKIIKINENKFLVTGTSLSPVSGNKSIANYGISNIWSIFIDSSGNLINQFLYGGDMTEQECMVDYNYTTNRIVYGCSSFSSASGNKTTALEGLVDGWIFVTDTLGVILSQESLSAGANSLSYLRDLKYNSNGRIFAAMDGVTGIGGDKTIVGYGDNDAWLVILDSDLNELNQSVYGGVSSEGLYSMGANGQNMILCIGSFSGADGNKTEINYGGIDQWILCINQEGNVLWQISAGGNANENEFKALDNGNNEFVIIGKTLSSVSGNKTVPLYVPGSSDLWYYRLSTTLDVNSIGTIPKISVVPNPFDENISFHWGEVGEEVFFTLKDAKGKVMTEQLITGSNQFDWSGSFLPSGVYFYEIVTSKSSYIGKIMKK